MDREALEHYIMETYSAGAEHLWARTPDCAVFRHPGNQKWFAAILDAPKRSLGLPGEGALYVLNVKCDPILSGSFRAEPGVYPGYHMNKARWLSIALDGSASGETIRALLEISFHLTAPKTRKTAKRQPPEH